LDSLHPREAALVPGALAASSGLDETAWAELNSTISRPFAKPEYGACAARVINHFGDEVQKVFFV